MSACAAKLERTGFVLRNVWPGVKHFGLEQSQSFAQSANESGFVRKNSHKVEVAASAGTSHRSRASSVLPRGARAAAQPPRLRLASRRLAPESLGGAALRPRARQISVGSYAEPKPLQPSVAALLPERLPEGTPVPEAAVPREEPRGKGGVSIEELVRTASEKYDLNRDFWGKYTDIPSMAQASDKDDILQIIDNFVLIHRKHVYLFQRLKNTVLKSLDAWSAPDLAALCHAWVQLGFLHEDLCVAMAGRVAATAHACNAQELCWLMDAYASARCSVQSALDELTKQTLRKLEDFTLPQLCLHASSFARLNLQHRLLFDCIGERLAALPVPAAPVGAADVLPRAEEDVVDDGVELLSARDLTLAAYSFAKLGFHNPRVFEAISRGSLAVIRDFTARDLQMFLVALARAQHRDPELLAALALQANRRAAQFSSESLALTLRSLAFFNLRDNPLFTRAVAQLPRTILHSRPADVTTLLNAFAAVQIHSVALVDIVTPFIMEKAAFFTPADWLGALRGYSSLGCRDAAFLSTLRLHLAASKLTLHQLCAAMVDCSRLSFSGLSAALAEAVATKVSPEGPALPADAAAQMYSALLLLGHSVAAEPAGEPVRSLLAELAEQLRGRGAAGQLSPAVCASLCYATLLAPPAKSPGGGSDARHPLDTSELLERCVAEAHSLSPEDRAMLRLVSQALQLLPWNRRALESVRRLETLTAAPSQREHLAPYFRSALAHLAPHIGSWSLPGKDGRSSSASCSGQLLPSGETVEAGPGAAEAEGAYQGVFVAREIQDALEDMSSVLSDQLIQHDVVLDLQTEAHIAIPRTALPPPASIANGALPPGSGQRREVALLWGSTVHYIRGAEPEHDGKVEPRLSPAARFQVSLLQELRSMDVVVVPHWRWPRNESVEARARVLASLVWESAAC